MIRDDLYRDVLRRLYDLEDMRVVYVSDGSPGGDKVAHLLAFAHGTIPALITLFQTWRREPPASPALEDARFKLALDVLHQPIDQGVLHLMESFQHAVGDD